MDLVQQSQKEMAKFRGREISMVFQEPMSALNPAMTCGRQITEILFEHLNLDMSEVLDTTTQLLQEVGIEEPIEAMLKYPHQFSGGQKQRLLIATAIAANPSLLIADEPTTALDSNIKKRINDLLHRIQTERKLSMLYITHDIDSIEQLADRIMVMFAGKIVEQGTAYEILHHPQHFYTQALLASRPPKTGRYYFLPTTQDFMRVSMDGTAVKSSAKVEELFEKLAISPSDRQRNLDAIYAQEPLLKVEHLYKADNRNSEKAERIREVVSDVSFDLYKGETLGLVGSSGCGKTTLGRCLLGLTDRDSGDLWIKDKKSNEYGLVPGLNRVGSRIQYIFQDPYSSLNPKHTIGKALLEPLQILGQGNQKSRIGRVNEMLAKVGLKPYHFDRYPIEFSGGQRQRIAIARALLLEPEIIICDEVVSALDVSVQAQVLNLLNELKYEYGLSYLFISHDLNVVRYMCDRILVMSEGKIVESGESDFLFQNPQAEETKLLLA